MKTHNQTLSFFSHFSLLSILFSQAALATEPVQITEPAPAVETVKAPEPVPAIEPVKDMRSISISGNVGFDAIRDTTVPGQEIKQQDTTVGMALETGNYTFEISMPYIQRSAPQGKIATSEHHESSKKSTAIAPIIANSGMGDVTSSLQYAILKEQDAPLSLSAKGGIKVATADIAKGLGTGKNDYSFELKAGKSLGDFTGNASIGYAVLGSPGNIQIEELSKSIYFNNIFFGSLSGNYHFSEQLETTAKLDMGQAIEIGGYQQRDLSVAMEYHFMKSSTLRLQVMKSFIADLKITGAYASLSAALF